MDYEPTSRVTGDKSGEEQLKILKSVTSFQKSVNIFVWDIEDCVVLAWKKNNGFIESPAFFTTQDEAAGSKCSLILSSTGAGQYRVILLKMLMLECVEIQRFKAEIHFGGHQDKPFAAVAQQDCLDQGQSLNLLSIPWPAIEQRSDEFFIDNQLSIRLKLINFMGEPVSTQFEQELVETGQDEVAAISESIKSLFNQSKFSDITIRCEEEQFPAHKLVLAGRSPVFARMMDSNMVECSEKIITIKDICGDTMKLALQYIYTGHVSNMDCLGEDQLLKLLNCAEKYDLAGLKLICLQKMFHSIRDDNVAKIGVAFHHYNASHRMKQQVVNYCRRRHDILIQDPEYKKCFIELPQVFLG